MNRNHPTHPIIVTAAVLCLFASTAQRAHGEQRLALSRIDRICYPADQEEEYGQLAYALRAYLKLVFDIQPSLEKGPPPKDSIAILLGREASAQQGLISADELESVRYDGYIIRVTDRAVALAGFQPQGTHYAVWRMFRMAGAGTYPNRAFSPPDTDAPSLPITIVKDKPFFEFRDCRGDVDRGVAGTTMRQYTLGSAGEAAKEKGLAYSGWLGWDHTAGYLVPISLYYDKHPEYFAQKPDGSRVPATAAASIVTLCTSNPEVTPIMTRRAMQWMSMQNHRRFFAITEGDSGQCDCANCRALDHHPYYTTDRLMRWVNEVARTAAVEHPEKKLFTFAYIRDVKPPVRLRPEPNVIPMYAPWVWTSRATSAVSWAHPLNTTAMEEFIDWTLTAPGQIGIYDYVYGDWVNGTAERVKFWARHGAKWVYMNGAPREPLFVWVNANLLWDPFQDTETLQAQFMQGYYGSSAEPMAAYHLLRQTAIKRNIIHDLQWGTDPTFLNEAPDLLDKADASAEQADERTRKRIAEATTKARREIKKYAEFADRETPSPIDVAVKFDQPDDVSHWVVDGSENIFLPPQPAPDDVKLRGTRVRLPLSKLPLVPNSMDDPIHAGVLYAERLFPEPIDAAGCLYFEFHISASTRVRCDVLIHGASSTFIVHPGEQILRVDLNHYRSNAYFDRAKWDHQIERVGFRFSPVSRDDAKDVEVDFFSMRCTNQPPQVDRLPHAGQAIWLSQFRPNHTPPGLVTGSEAPEFFFKTHGEKFTHPTKSRWKQFHGGRIKFRSNTPHKVLTPLYTIHIAENADEKVTQAAHLMQGALKQLFGVQLPVVPTAHPQNNSILLGADLTPPDVITPERFAFAGSEGYVIDVRNGRAVIAGPDPAGTAHGVVRYLAEYDAVINARGQLHAPPLHVGHRGMLHELYLIDRPWFKDRAVPGGWYTAAQGNTAPGNETVSIADIQRAAASIKDAARSEQTEPPAEAIATAKRSPLAAYVVAHLLWNPLTDTSRLLREGSNDFTNLEMDQQ